MSNRWNVRWAALPLSLWMACGSDGTDKKGDASDEVEVTDGGPSRADASDDPADDRDGAAADAGADDAGGDAAGEGTDSGLAGGCDADNAGLKLPAGFCASVFASELGKPRHITVTPSGDLYVAIAGEGAGPSFVALRDADHDGKAEQRIAVGGVGGNGIVWANGKLYFAANAEVHVYDAADGTLAPTAGPSTLIAGLPAEPDHYAKSLAFEDKELYVNVGSASNACQVENRKLESPGIDPCPELSTRAGVWKFSATRLNQTQADGLRFVSGARNLNALAINGENRRLYGAQNGRDQLYENWPKLFSEADDQRLPAEGVYELNFRYDLGWPYCFYDAEAKRSVLSPEYGGDGKTVGRCSTAASPTATLPAHWAPLGMVFYEHDHFPARYRHGAFIANHGSRFAGQVEPAPGYNVVFIPFAEGKATGPYERFAEGFIGATQGALPDVAQHRPVGVAVGPDGALYISDDKGGRLFRVVYRTP